jgi:hypothetical protein
VNLAVFAICFGLGEGLSEIDAAVGTLALVLLVLAVRSIGGAVVAERVAPARLRVEAPFAVAFKNIALAAAVGGSVAGTAAALPALLGFATELACFLWLARRTARRQTSPSPR